MSNEEATIVAPKRPVLSPEERAAKRAHALKFTDDGRPATMAALTTEERAELSNNERLKIEKSAPKVWQDVVERYAEGGFDAIDADDFERFKWLGIYQQRPKDGYFMIRLKIPGGWVNNETMRVCAGMARDFARGIADITTRQTFQMHWLTIGDVPEIMDRLETVGLGVKKGLFGACGDICRNLVSNPLTGVDPKDVLDPTDFVWEATNFFSSHPDYADMPRKFKVGVFGHRAGGQCETNCMSLYGVTRADGEVGYGLMIGGGLSTEPYLAQEIGVFVTPERAMAVLEAVARTYRDYGYRKNRKHARLKYLMVDWGVAKMREEIEKILGYALPDAEEQAPVKGYEDQLGVHPQKQDGLNFIGVPVIAGRVTAEQMEAMADIAEECGSGDIRLTVMQSFYVINVPDDKVALAQERLRAAGFPLESTAIGRGIVACTGIEFCNLAVTETKNRAMQMVELLDAKVKWSDSEFFRINVNGCPNSCGQHWIADVGLQGCTKKIDGELVEHFDIFLGGTLGDKARFNHRIKRLPHDEVVPAIAKVIEEYKSSKQGEESFAQWAERHSDEELEALF